MYDDTSGLHHHAKFTFLVVEVKVFTVVFHCGVEKILLVRNL